MISEAFVNAVLTAPLEAEPLVISKARTVDTEYRNGVIYRFADAMRLDDPLHGLFKELYRTNQQRKKSREPALTWNELLKSYGLDSPEAAEKAIREKTLVFNTLPPKEATIYSERKARCPDDPLHFAYVKFQAYRRTCKNMGKDNPRWNDFLRSIGITSSAEAARYL